MTAIADTPTILARWMIISERENHSLSLAGPWIFVKRQQFFRPARTC